MVARFDIYYREALHTDSGCDECYKEYSTLNDYDFWRRLWLLGLAAAGVAVAAFIEGDEQEQREQQRLERQTLERKAALDEQEVRKLLKYTRKRAKKLYHKTCQALSDTAEQYNEQEEIKDTLNHNIEQSLISIQSLTLQAMTAQPKKRHQLEAQLVLLKTRRTHDVQALEGLLENQQQTQEKYESLQALREQLDEALVAIS